MFTKIYIDRLQILHNVAANRQDSVNTRYNPGMRSPSGAIAAQTLTIYRLQPSWSTGIYPRPAPCRDLYPGLGDRANATEITNFQ